MSWFWGKSNPESYTKVFGEEMHKEPKPLAQTEMDKKIAEGVKVALEKARYKDLKAARQKEIEAFEASYAPVGPRYKISENPEGGYFIQERRVRFMTLSGMWDGYRHTPLSLEDLEDFTPKVTEHYIPLHKYNNGRQELMRFPTFDEAEYYLLRTASPEAYETHYDGEPLRRVKKTSTR